MEGAVEWEGDVSWEESMDSVEPYNYPTELKKQIAALGASGVLSIEPSRLKTITDGLDAFVSAWDTLMRDMELSGDPEQFFELINSINAFLTASLKPEEIVHVAFLPDMSDYAWDEDDEVLSRDITGLLPELWEYVKTSIAMPLRDARAAFESQVSHGDRRELNRVRSMFRQLVPMIDDAVRVINNERQLDFLFGDTSTVPELQRINDFVEEHEDVMELYNVLYDKYREEVVQFLISADVDWYAMMEGACKIIEPFIPEVRRSLTEDPEEAVEETVEMIAWFFLLLEPGGSVSADEELSWTSVKPNPATSFMELTVRLKEDATVNVTILNRAGVPLMQVVSEQRSKGRNVFVVDVSSLPNDIYYYSIRTDDREGILKFVVMR